MPYRIAEGSLALADEWHDRSVNVLLPTEAAAEGANLVIARDRLPLGMAFATYVDQQRQNFGTHFAKFRMIVDTAGEIDGRPSHFFELDWENDGKPIHQVMATVLRTEAEMLQFTGTIPGGPEAATRDTLVNAILSFSFA